MLLSHYNSIKIDLLLSTMSFANFSRASLPYFDLFVGFEDFFFPTSLFLVPLGVVVNIINIVVFFKTGSKDNVTISLLALSMSDLTFLVVISPRVVYLGVANIVQRKLGIPLNWLVDPSTLWVPFYWYSFVFYDTSSLITVYISVVRCACVALPFNVKDMFTARRALITFLVFFICVFFLRLPMIMIKRFVRIIDRLTNSSKVAVVEIDDGGVAHTINDIVSRNIQPWSCFIITITCLVVMVTKLRASARFRDSLSAKDSGIANNRSLSTPRGEDENDAEIKSTATTDEKSKVQVMSAREIKILRAVILVAVIFVVFQAPFMVYSLGRRLQSEFDDDEGVSKIPRYSNLFGFASNFSVLCAFMNSTVNIVVYYNYNSRYRQCLRAMLKIRGK